MTPYVLPSGSVYPHEVLRERARQAAAHRRQLKAQTVAGQHTLADLFDLARRDTILSRTRVKSLLGWLPGVGTKRVQRILTDSRVGPERRLRALTDGQKDRLLNHPHVIQHARRVTHQPKEWVSDDE